MPPGIYRETVTITKPITLVAQPGAEIRGSDDWSTGWTRSGVYWLRGTVPAFPIGNWPCDSSSNGRCDWPQQVFFDGKPLYQVAANPVSGQFAVNAARQVVLADNPSGHLVEVTTRQYWIIGQADNVTIQGFTMKHAATPAQQGAISNGGHANWTIAGNTLSDAHGAVVSLDNATGLKLLDNDISRGGQEGVHSYNAVGAVIQGNRVHDNNTEGFATGWEAGGMKLATARSAVISANDVESNTGPGVWCDVDCASVSIGDNTVAHNTEEGIKYEISSGGTIANNRVWDNGWGFPDWGWGAGIVVQNSSNTTVNNNIVAWNADGISVISQNRAGYTNVVNDTVHDNTIVINAPTGSSNVIALGWLQDWSGTLGAPSSNNVGYQNSYWHQNPQGSPWPFAYASAWFPYDQLVQFSQTPGEHNGQYLTSWTMASILSAVGIPTSPTHP